MYQQNFDFSIPAKYRGKEIGLPKSRIKLLVPKEGVYLDVNPLENEEEFLGCQDNSNRQQIFYYDANEKLLNIAHLDGLILTGELMKKLENIFEVKY